MYVMTDKPKDLGSYQLELCASDGYANPVCAKFTLSIEDPVKSKKIKGNNNDADFGTAKL